MTPAPSSAFDTTLIWLIAGWAVLGLGAVLLLWALFRDRSRGRRRCPKCWYDMKGVPGLRCPECGREARVEKKLHKTQRRYAVAILSLFIILLGTVSTRVPRALKHGWLDAVPVVLLRPALWWERERAGELYSETVGQARAFTSIGQQRFRTSGPPPGIRTAAIKTAPSQWGQLLCASECARRMAADQAEAARVAGDLGRDSRPAHAAMRSLLKRDPSVYLVQTMSQLSIAGDASFKSDLLRASELAADPDVVEAALTGLLQISIKEGWVSTRLRSALLRRPFRSTMFTDWVRACQSAGPTNAAGISMLGTLLHHEDPIARRLAESPLVLWTITGHRFDAVAEELWNDANLARTGGTLALLVAPLQDRAALWGPRLVRMAEDENESVRVNALGVLNYWLAKSVLSEQALNTWLGEIDRYPPLPGQARRAAHPWIIDALIRSRELDVSASINLARAFGADSTELWNLMRPLAFADNRPGGRKLALIEIGQLGRSQDDILLLAAEVVEHDQDPVVRAAAFTNLISLNPTDARAHDLVLEGLRDGDERVQAAAAEVAADLPGVSPQMVARLTELGQGPGYVAQTARRTLERLHIEFVPRSRPEVP